MKNLFLTLTLALLLTACGKSEPLADSALRAATSAGGNAPSPELAGEAKKGMEGVPNITAETLFKGPDKGTLPDYFPQYPGSKLHHYGVMRKGDMTTAEMTTADSAEKVMAYYKAKIEMAKMPIGLEQAGPTIYMIQAGDVAFLSAKQKEMTVKGVSVSVIASVENGQTKVELVARAPTR
jgi:hypothetical protein